MLEATIRLLNKIRSCIWPIQRHELKKLIPMFLMLFFVCVNYTVLRNLKDALVITAKSSGAEVIPFIKVWVMLPAAVVSTILFTYFANRFSFNRVFYLVIGLFLVFFCLFTFGIYPYSEQLEASNLTLFLHSVLPKGLSGFIAMIQNWPLTLFYVAAELWSTMVLTVLFWGFANQITRLNEAPRFYSALNISSNIAPIIAGQLAVLLSSNLFDPNFFFGSSATEQMLDKLTLLILACGVGILLSYVWMTKHALNDEASIQQVKVRPKKENKMGFLESLSTIANSRYLLSIALIVVSYNLVIHMVEVIWKDSVKELYPNANEYNIYMNNLTTVMGIISTSAALAMSGIIRKLGWTKTALITPLVLFATTAAFFGCLIAGNSLEPYIPVLLATTSTGLAVFLGSMQNCFSKAAKYTLFDCTKEMAFIPLNPEIMLKGKAAIDGIGSRLGKSGGSLIHQGLLIVFGTLGASTPIVGIILLGVLALWIMSVKTLGKQFAEHPPVQEPSQPQAVAA